MVPIHNVPIHNRNVVFVSSSSVLIPRHMLMIRALKAYGWHISVLAWDRNGDAATKVLDCIDNWRWIRIKAPTWSLGLLFILPKYYMLLWKELSTTKKPSLLVISHFFLLPVGFFWRGRKVYDSAEMFAWDLSLYFGALRRFARPCLSFVEGMLTSCMDGVLSVDSNGGWLERFFRRWNQWVQVIWNVPSLEDDPKKFDVKALEINYEGRNVVAYVGGLMHEKGLRVAIEMAAKVKDYHPEVLFLFIGPMKDDPKEIEKLIRRNGLNKHIRILRLMPYRKMLAHLRHALIGLALSQQARIYPLVSAGNGRKFFTYMQAGLAIIGPEFGEIGKAVKMADCGVLVNTESPQAVADAVSRLLDNPDELKRLRRNARAAFEQRFNWEKERPKFVRFIAEVMR